MTAPPIVLASPRGFCAGVSYAIDIVDLVLERYGPPVYVRHEIVHNRYVVEKLRSQGARFVEELADVPDGALLIFSAHGVAPAVRDEARTRNLRVVDATCPLVTKVHVEVLRYARDGYDILLIGHRGHVEVIGTLGHAPERMQLIESVVDVERVNVRDPERVAVVTQTTLSVDDTRAIIEAIRQRFPHAHTPRKDDICYATQNRQTAVKELARQSDLVLVIGSPASSNANRLVEVARNEGTPARLIEAAGDIDAAWLRDVRAVGLTAGASTPEALVEATIACLQSLGCGAVRDLTTAIENVTFPLPRELREPAARDVPL
ncbi:MAG: 4-hydroxy-3-methylbut-2-enyl diphosphate reductase [Deltaproteobacteria bacterium]|nr:4-hydroxy-3-methylbut-2-enyl diphosphate reductase [Deltaproteobacteria bacterium]MBI3386594.1 4-hydroxy-3-methylbut-2-enyl diphosphate reductase [Deltaproteobacteria bacterium]